MSTDLYGEDSWKLCFKVGGVQLPTGYYFGVSAATGDLSGETLAESMTVTAACIVHTVFLFIMF